MDTTSASSPRERGCSPGEPDSADPDQIFPARAGVFPDQTACRDRYPDLPRESGGVPMVYRFDEESMTSSPRERGCSPDSCVHARSEPIFPARAGVFPTGTRPHLPRPYLPRESGGVPLRVHQGYLIDLSSPRERGCSHKRVLGLQAVLIFPARAGVFPWYRKENKSANCS